jgi:hypothetical protein
MKLERINPLFHAGIDLILAMPIHSIKNGMNGTSSDGRSQGIWPMIVIIGSFTAGRCLLMWLGEQITEFGIETAYPSFCSSVSCRASEQPLKMFQAHLRVAAPWWALLLL